MDQVVIWLYIVVLATLAVYGVHRSQLVYLFLKTKRRSIEPKQRFKTLPMVTVQLPMFNERYVAERLVAACGEIDWPKDRLEIQVLDDSTDDTVTIAAAAVEKLRAQGVDATYIHRTNRTGFKAGALENGMRTAKGDYVAVFDADFVPPPAILRQTVDHFTDSKVAMVQARWGHINREYSTLTRVQSMMLDGHFVIEHAARNRSGRFFNFNGTAGIWRRSAIIDAGGWQHDTLTEDMDLSYRAQLRGWKFVYLNDVVAPAEIPVEMNSFKSQQFRWAKGSIQTARKLLPMILKSNVPWKVKLEAFFHLTNNMAYLLLCLLAILLLPNLLLRTEHGIREVLLIDLPLFFGTTLSIASFYLVAHRQLYGNVSSAIRRLPLLMSLGIGLSINNARAVLEGLFGHDSEFIRTPKHGVAEKTDAEWKKKRYRAARTFVPLVEFAFAAYFVVALVVAARGGHWLSMPFLALFLVGYLYVATLSVHQTR
jgi:cellulose synthase/poly-beta-1,6-N-acetylglucosamine synthase-like glycosyltransferase